MNDEERTAPLAEEKILPAEETEEAAEETASAEPAPELPAPEANGGEEIPAEEVPAPEEPEAPEPEPIAEPAPEAAPVPDPNETIERLTRALEEARAAAERLADGYAELAELYPGADLRSMPDSFRDAVKEGVPPAAAYALELRRREVAQQRAEEASRAAREASAGAVGGRTPTLLSPGEVRAMTREEIRENYSLILDSMRLW